MFEEILIYKWHGTRQILAGIAVSMEETTLNCFYFMQIFEVILNVMYDKSTQPQHAMSITMGPTLPHRMRLNSGYVIRLV